MHNQNFLLDKDFLKKLDVYPRREIYARITSLTFNEEPIEQIEGLITAGSVNVDGTSSIRRSCSLTMISDQLNIKDYLWAIKTKFRLEIGLRNEIDNKYPDICWFPLGLYVITSFTSSIQSNNRSISIQGKDKMCLLTGDLSGNLPSIIDFGREEWYDYDYTKVIIESRSVYNQQKKELYIYQEDLETKIKKPKRVVDIVPEPSYSATQTYYKKAEVFTVVNNLTAENYNYNIDELYYIQEKNNYTQQYEYVLAKGNFDETLTYYQKTVSQIYHITPLTIQKIIKESIHTWAREPYSNIIIKDLDVYGLEQIIYNSHNNVPMYIIKNTDNNTFNVTLDGEMNIWVKGDHENDPSHRIMKTLKDLSIEQGFIFDTGIIDATKIKFSNNSDYKYTVLKIEDTDDCGYRITDLTYVPADGLICSIGEALSSILDKIKNMLGDFEYFYNLQGQFIFQRKPASTNVNLSAVHNIDLQNLYVDASVLLNKVEYDFTDNYLISAINLNPTLNNVKNDFAIQGQRTTASGANIPIRLRYAIDKKPKYYKAIDGTIYMSKEYYKNQENEQTTISFQQLKRINKSTGAIEDVADGQVLSEAKDAIWNEITAYIDAISIDNTFWDLHHAEWWTTENNIFSRSNGLIQSSNVKINQADYNITINKAGWWDLEAWQKFYEVVTQQKAKYNLVLYSGQSLNLYQNSKKWKDLGVFKDSFQTGSNLHHWLSPQGTGDYAQPINEDDRVFIIIVDKYNAGNGNEVATIMPMNKNYAYDTLYETTYDGSDNIIGSHRAEPYTAVSYSYPEIFSILPSWTCDYAVKTLIKQDAEHDINRMAWIFNPQFPEGSFKEAFAEGVKNYLNQNQSYIYFYASDIQVVDWRELIYQMSKDYLKYAMSDNIVTTAEIQHIFGTDWWPYGQAQTVEEVPEEKRLVWRDIFTSAIKYLNPEDYPTGITGYEQYYTDINAFWRQLYNPNVLETISINPDGFYEQINTQEEFNQYKSAENCYKKINGIYQKVNSDESYSSLIQYYKYINELWTSEFFINKADYEQLTTHNPNVDKSSLKALYHSDELRGWNYKLYYNPTALDFWFDFLEDGEVADRYSVRQIGLRTKAVNNDKVKAVYFTKVPLICYYAVDGTEGWKDKTEDQIIKESGYSFVALPVGMDKYFTISSRGISAKDELDNLLYQHSYIPENITLTSLPIYYLEPNTRIYVHDDEAQIDGEYIMTKFTLPLTYNGTMSITANKAPERIL